MAVRLPQCLTGPKAPSSLSELAHSFTSLQVCRTKDLAADEEGRCCPCQARNLTPSGPCDEPGDVTYARSRAPVLSPPPSLDHRAGRRTAALFRISSGRHQQGRSFYSVGFPSQERGISQETAAQAAGPWGNPTRWSRQGLGEETVKSLPPLSGLERRASCKA